jgi:chaperone required for assembly of F1-ATPase
MAKRFYKTVDISTHKTGFHVTLDGRVLKTPGKNQLVCPSRSQAEQVAAEWQAQVDEIKPETMPCTRLMNVACEMTPTRRPELVAEYRKYCGTDLLCYRAAHPVDLGERQGEQWQPVLDWADKTHQIALAVTTGLEALPQLPISLNAAEGYADACDDFGLTLLMHYTASFGSAVLSLAVLEKHLNVEEAFNLSTLDEQFQNERWGTDDDAVARNAALLSELTALSKLI